MSTETELNEKDLELISKSLDEDLSEFERRRLNQNILTTEEGEKTWFRYNAVSAVMSRQFPAEIDKNFSQQVMQAINSDESIISDDDSKSYNRMGSYLKQTAGLAVAASVAVVSIVAFQQFNQPTVSQPAQIVVSEQASNPVEPKEIINISPVATPAYMPQVEFLPAQASQDNVIGVNPFDETNTYMPELDFLKNHAEFDVQDEEISDADIIELEDIQN